jgi:hypothetical protein
VADDQRLARQAFDSNAAKNTAALMRHTASQLKMGHGFDDQGAKSDAKGVLHTWWLPEDTAAFKVLVDKLAIQYDTYEAVGLHLNGPLTLGENIGDLSGVTVAYEAKVVLNATDVTRTALCGSMTWQFKKAAKIPASNYEPGGREFESLRARQESTVHSGHIADDLYRGHR